MMKATTPRPRRTQSQLAWDLALAIAPRLNRSHRTQLFARIGAGETYPAIEELLTRAAHNGYPVGESLADDIGHWVRGYAGTIREPRLRVIVAQLRVGESDAVDVRAQNRCAES